MPRNFCFNYRTEEFRVLAHRLGISLMQLRNYASLYVDMNGMTSEEFDAVFEYGGKGSAYYAFRDFVKSRLAGRGRSAEGNHYSTRRDYDKAVKVWTYYNGRRVRTITSGELATIALAFPAYEIYVDRNGYRRIAIDAPVYDPKRGGSFLAEKSTTYVEMAAGSARTQIDDAVRDILNASFAGDPDYLQVLKVTQDSFRRMLESRRDMRSINVTSLLDLYVQNRISDMMNARKRAHAGPDTLIENATLFGINKAEAALFEGYDEGAGEFRDAKGNPLPVGSDVLYFPATDQSYELTTHDKMHIGRLIAAGITRLVDKLCTDPTARDRLFPNQFAGYDFTKMKRRDVIKTVTLAKLSGFYRWNRLGTEEHMSFDASVKWAIFNSNYRELIRFAYPAIMDNEGFAKDDVLVSMHDPLKPDDVTLQDVFWRYAFEHGEGQMFEDNDRKISSVARLPAKFRRFLNTVEVTDADGNVIADPEGYGVPALVNSISLLISLRNMTQKCLSWSEMRAVLESAQDVPGVRQILERCDADPQFEAQTYNVLRYDIMRYGFVEGADEGGVRRLKFTEANGDAVARSYANKVVMRYLTGDNPLFRVPAARKGVYGRGVTDTDVLARVGDSLNRVMRALATTRGDRGAARADVVNGLAEAFRLMGMPDIDVRTVSAAVGAISGPVENTVAYRAAVALRSLADLFDTPAGVEFDIPFGLADFSDEMNRGALTATESLKGLVEMFVPYMDVRVEPFIRRNGSSYFVYGRPNYVTDLARSLNSEQARAWIMENFGPYKFHVMDSVENLSSVNWLRTCLNPRTPFGVRELLDNGKVEYNKMSRPEYMQSLLVAYKKSDRSDVDGTAEYAMVMGERNALNLYSGPKYRLETTHNGVRASARIVDGIAELINQEIVRMKSVFEKVAEYGTFDEKGGLVSVDRQAMGDPFDKVPDEIVMASESARRRRLGLKGAGSGRALTREMLSDNGLLSTRGTGLSFRFVEELNEDIVKGTELGEMILARINGEEVDDGAFLNALEERIYGMMEDMVQSEIGKAREAGLFDTREADVGGTRLSTYRFLDGIIDETPDETARRIRGDGQLGRAGRARYNEDRRRLAEDLMREFLWNDYYARAQIFKLTLSDLAYFPTIEKAFQYEKSATTPRYPLHRGARDRGGVEVSDGYMRAVYVNDMYVKSEAKSAITSFYDNAIRIVEREMRNARTQARREELGRKRDQYVRLRDGVPALFDKINATDGQSWTSITGARKFLISAGYWEDEMEDAYQHMMEMRRSGKGEWTLGDVDVMIQVMKPIMYGFESVDYNRGADATVGKMKQLAIYKTSTMMLAFAGTMMQGDKSRNVLKAMLDFMEDTAYDNGNGRKYEYNQHGVDMILGSNAVKGGRHHMVDLPSCGTYDEAMKLLKESCVTDDGYTESVHTVPIESFGFVQENPTSLMDGYIGMGSQGRGIVAADFDPTSQIEVRGKVESAGKLTAEYERLLAENIRSSFDRVAEEFDVHDTDSRARDRRISKILSDSILKGSNPDMDLFYAVQLDENGRLNVPPNDLILAKKIQNHVNSMVRNTINKQRMPGGHVVQMSDAYFPDDLNIRFQDKDGNLLETFGEFCRRKGVEKSDSSAAMYEREVLGGRPAERLAYFEVRLNIPDSELKDALRKPDGTFMTPEEAVKAGIITEEALKVIAERIPTEGKYSMIPMRIVGFNADESGEIISMPKEITLLTGTDFDVDAMYCTMKEFSLRREWLKGGAEAVATRYVDEVLAGRLGRLNFDRAKEIRRQTAIFSQFIDGEGRTSGGVEYDDQLDFFERNAKEFCKYTFVENEYKEGGENSYGAKMNRAFDIMWGLMTSVEATAQAMNPGGFENLKRISNIARIMQLEDYSRNVAKYGTYRELLKKPLSDLEKILERAQSLHPLRFSTLVHFQQENVAGKKMVGWAANNTVSHAFMSRLEIPLRLIKDFNDFMFDGVRVNGQILDPVLDRDGNYVSKTLSSISAASVDAPKYQTLKAMNYNDFTSNAYNLLIRLGFGENMVNLFIGLPCIREMADIYAKERNSGRYLTAEQVAAIYMENHPKDFVMGEKGMEVSQGLSAGESNLGFTESDLLKVYYGQDGGAFVNAMAVGTFVRMNTAGNSLFKLSHYTKVNSWNEALGSTIGHAVVNGLGYQAFLDDYFSDDEESGKRIVDKEGARRIFTANEILRAFYETTYSEGQEVNYSEGKGADRVRQKYAFRTGIEKLIFRNYTPVYTDGFKQALNLLVGGTKGRITPERVNEMVNAYTLYGLYSADGNTRFRAARDRFEYFTDPTESGFIYRTHRVKEWNAARPERYRNRLLEALNFYSSSDRCPVMTVGVSLAGIDMDGRQDLKDAWTDLYNDPETRDFAEELMEYAVLRNGISDAPNSLAQLIPWTMKHGVREYREGLGEANMNIADGYTADPRTFMVQYLRNKTGDSEMVPHVDFRRGQVRRDRHTGEWTFARDADLSGLMTKGVRIGRQYRVRYALVAVINGTVCVNVSRDLDVPRYRPTTPLGVTGYFTEFNTEDSRGAFCTSFFEGERRRQESGENVSDFYYVLDEMEDEEVSNGSPTAVSDSPNVSYDVAPLLTSSKLSADELHELSLTLNAMGPEGRELYDALSHTDAPEMQRRLIRKYALDHLDGESYERFRELYDQFC